MRPSRISLYEVHFIVMLIIVQMYKIQHDTILINNKFVYKHLTIYVNIYSILYKIYHVNFFVILIQLNLIKSMGYCSDLKAWFNIDVLWGSLAVTIKVEVLAETGILQQTIRDCDKSVEEIKNR